MVIQMYYSSITATVKMDKEQKKIEDILSSKKYNYEKFDIAQSEECKQKMRDLMGNPTGLAPQLCKDDTYLGGYEAFEEAVECETLDAFLKESPQS